jgi:hypothetical protein
MNPFERHGIKRLSPSSLNLWQGEPALWVLKYLHKMRDDAGPAAKRGQAVEAGLDHFLAGNTDVQFCMTSALDNFALNTGGVIDDDHDEERNAIPLMLEQAMAACKDAPRLLARQVAIETWLDGIDVPVIGYCDYVLEDGAIIDLKTTHRMPSSPKNDHVRQVAVYQKARQAPVSLLYVTTKKFSRMRISQDDCDTAIADMTRVARSLQSILSVCETADDAKRFVAPDFSKFYWNEETRKTAMGVWK